MISPEQKAKIKWQCRRGMLELDLIFERFLTHKLDDLTAEQLMAFDLLLDAPDPDLYAWLMGYEKTTNKELEDIVTYIRLHDTLK